LTTKENLHPRDIKEVMIMVPEIDEQRVVVDLVDKILYKVQQAAETASKTIEMIDLMKKSILAKAFRGELGTNNPEEEGSIELLKQILEQEE
jgi:type I restriction enzyme S subunit